MKIMVYALNISNMNFGGGGGRTYSNIHFSFIIKKNKKVQEHEHVPIRANVA